MGSNQFYLQNGPQDPIKFLRIPIYQRPYSWGNKQIEKLLDDFSHSFRTKKDEPYFLGTISLFEKINSSYYDVLDGQQRLTTSTLLAAWLKHNLNVDYFDNFLLVENEPRIDFQTRESIKIEFDSFIKEGFNSYGEAFSNEVSVSILRNAITIFGTYFNEKNLERHNFAKWLSEKVIFFWIKVPIDSKKYTLNSKPQSLYKYYDAVNTIGKQLEKTDVLRSKLLAILNESGLAMSDYSDAVEDAFNQYIEITQPYNVIKNKKELQAEYIQNTARYSNLKDILLKKPTEQNKTKTLNFNENRHLIKGWDLAEMALKVYLKEDTFSYWKTLSVDEIIHKIKNDKDLHPVEASIKFIRILCSIRLYLDRLFIRPSETNIPEILAKDFSKLSVSEEEDNSDSEEEDNRIRGLKNKVRLLQEALNGSTLQSHQWIFPSLKYLYYETDNLKNVTWESFYQAMIKTEKDRSKDYFKEKPTLDLSYRDKHVAYYLNMIDYLLACESKDGGSFSKMKFPSRNSVEHIIARNTRNENGNEIELPVSFDKDKIYNLGLLTSYRNSAYKDLDFNRKRELFKTYKETSGYYESLRLKEIYSLQGTLREILADLEKIGKKHDDLFQNWLMNED